MVDKFAPRFVASSEDERFEAKRTVSFKTIVNGVQVEFDVTVPWAHDLDDDEAHSSEAAAGATGAGADRAPPSA